MRTGWNTTEIAKILAFHKQHAPVVEESPAVLVFANGDKATGESTDEDGRTWYKAIDANGMEYETDEAPTSAHSH